MRRKSCHCKHREVCGNPFFAPPSLRSRVNGCGNPLSFKGITDSFAPSAQNDKPFSHCKHREVCGNPFSAPPSLRRCGCPVDTSAKQKRRPSRQARYVNGCGNPLSFKGITDSFAPSAQNDKPFSHCKHREARGNPFSFKWESKLREN